MIITIDGPAGTGKSTAAKKLAEAIGFTYFDTGALYRAISWSLLEHGVSCTDEEALSAHLKSFTFRIKTVGDEKRYFVGDRDVTKEIRTKEVTAIVSKVAALKLVRDALKPLQVNFGREMDVIFEGRDLGSVVFPHAQLKFYLTASAEVRARRRYRELVCKFPEQSFSYDSILSDIEKRDAFDSEREHAPLVQPEDAVLVDTSDLSIEEVTEKLKEIYLAKCKK